MSKRKKQKNKQTVAEITDLGSEASIETATVIDERRRMGGLTSWIRAHRIATALIALGLFTVTASALRYLDEDAKKQRQLPVKNRSALSAINPFIPPPTATPTPQLSKEYIYAGSRLLAVEDANASAVPPADVAVWRPWTGVWYVLGGVPGSQQTSYTWGTSGDVPVPGDFDGDGKTDFAIWRPGTTATWYIVPSSTGTYYTVNQGVTNDIPKVADFDGDGKTDLVLYRPSNNNFYINKSSGGTLGAQWGSSGDVPVPHDYDGDGVSDFAVWRPSNHTYYTVNSSNPATGYTIAVGANGDLAVPCDYDGDGKADFATFINGYWTIKYSDSGSTTSYSYGTTSDIAVQNDYDADGKCDRAIFRPSNGNWWIRKSSTDTDRNEVWGTNGDIPVPAYFRR